jgi:hypothetical protein
VTDIGQDRKYFFFEKKKQKTFALLVDAVGTMDTYRRGKSFLVLFFKKELLPWRFPVLPRAKLASSCRRYSPHPSGCGLRSDVRFQDPGRGFSSARAVTCFGWMRMGGGEAVDDGDQTLMRGLDTA